jgi:hypothetical protein
VDGLKTITPNLQKDAIKKVKIQLNRFNTTNDVSKKQGKKIVIIGFVEGRQVWDTATDIYT